MEKVKIPDGFIFEFLEFLEGIMKEKSMCGLRLPNGAGNIEIHKRDGQNREGVNFFIVTKIGSLSKELMFLPKKETVIIKTDRRREKSFSENPISYLEGLKISINESEEIISRPQKARSKK